MISDKMQAALNDQVNEEFYSAYLYLAMSSYCQTIGLPGFAHWMRLQYEEENMHVTKMYDYILNQGGAALNSIWSQTRGDETGPGGTLGRKGSSRRSAVSTL